MPEIDASVRTRVVSWNDAALLRSCIVASYGAQAEMNESVESDALVIPRSTRPALRRTSRITALAWRMTARASAHPNATSSERAAKIRRPRAGGPARKIRHQSPSTHRQA